MSAADTKTLIAQAVERLRRSCRPCATSSWSCGWSCAPAAETSPIWRVELPGPKVDRDPAADARIDVSVARPRFNKLAEEGLLEDWGGPTSAAT